MEVVMGEKYTPILDIFFIAHNRRNGNPKQLIGKHPSWENHPMASIPYYSVRTTIKDYLTSWCIQHKVQESS